MNVTLHSCVVILVRHTYHNFHYSFHISCMWMSALRTWLQRRNGTTWAICKFCNSSSYHH